MLTHWIIWSACTPTTASWLSVLAFEAEWPKSQIYLAQQKLGHRQLQSWWHLNQNAHDIQRGLRRRLHFPGSTICTGPWVNKSLLCIIRWLGHTSMSLVLAIPVPKDWVGDVQEHMKVGKKSGMGSKPRFCGKDQCLDGGQSMGLWH